MSSLGTDARRGGAKPQDLPGSRPRDASDACRPPTVLLPSSKEYGMGILPTPVICKPNRSSNSPQTKATADLIGLPRAFSHLPDIKVNNSSSRSVCSPRNMCQQRMHDQG